MNSESTHTSDAALLERLRSGDQAAFDELFRRYRSWVLGICHRELGDRELAEDAASAVFLVLHRKAPSLRPDSSIASWLFTVSMLCVKNAKRTETRTMNLHAKLDPPENRSNHDTHTHQALRQALMGLRDTERHAIELYYLEELTISEISDRLGIKEGACRMRLRRALESLRRKLGPEGFAALPGALGTRAISDSVGISTASPAAVGLAVRLTKALAAQTALRAAALSIVTLGAATVGVGLAHAKMGHEPSTPAKSGAVAQVAQSAPPALPAAPPVPDGPLAAGTAFRISFYRDGQVVDTRTATTGKDGFALVTLDLSPWPGLKRAACDSKGLDEGWRKGLKQLGDNRSLGVLKFAVRYLPSKNGQPRQTLFDGAFLGGSLMKMKVSYDAVLDLRFTAFTVLVNPDADHGTLMMSSKSPEWQKRPGQPWELVTGPQREKEIGDEFLRLAGLSTGAEARGPFEGMVIEKLEVSVPPQ